MSVIAGPEGVRLIVFILLIVWAAGLVVYDWRQRRLPNWLLVNGALIGAVHGAAYGTLPYGAGILDGAGTATLALLLLWPLYRMGWMGAGDVKLCAVIGWLGGAKVLLAVFLIGTAIGGLFGLALLVPRLAVYLAGPGLEPRLRRRIPFGSGLAAAFIAWTAAGLYVGQTQSG